MHDRQDTASARGTRAPEPGRPTDTETGQASGNEPTDLGGLSGSPAVDPAVEERILLGRLEALMKAHPERMARFIDEVQQVIDENRPLNTERTLNAHQGARIAGCSHVNLLRHLDGGRIGERDAQGRPRFSEAECDAFRRSERKRGRPKKSDDADSNSA